MAGSWSDSDVFSLIGIWGDEEIQRQLEIGRRKSDVFEKIARELSQTGAAKTATQCREKIKKLRSKYKNLKDGHNISGNSRDDWIFYDAMDEILGCRHAVNPPVVLETIVSSTDTGHTIPSPSVTPTTASATATPTIASATVIPITESATVIPITESGTVIPTTASATVIPATPSATVIPTISTTPTSGRKRPQRKSPRKAKRVDPMDKIIDKIATVQRDSDSKFLDIEKKRLEMDEKILSSIQQLIAHNPGYGGGSHGPFYPSPFMPAISGTPAGYSSSFYSGSLPHVPYNYAHSTTSTSTTTTGTMASPSPNMPQ